MLFTNPDVVGSFPSFRFKVLGGSFSDPELMGNELYGSYTVNDAYKILPADNVHTSSHSNCYVHGSRGMYAKDTLYYFYNTINLVSGNYAILEWELTHPTWGEFSEFEYRSGHYHDYYMVSYSLTDRRIYQVRKLTGSFTGTSYHTFG